MRKAFVTGAAGFIGSNLTDRLLAQGKSVVGYDNFSTGFEQFLQQAANNPKFSLVQGDMLDQEALGAAMTGCDFVFHLAANADVRFGLENPRKDLDQNTIATFTALECARLNGIEEFAFSSTGSVYGEPKVFPTPEDAPFPVQTSLYAASKLACEGLISAYCEGYSMRGWIFRFVSVLGQRYTHGHVFDFLNKLKEDPARLHILGDGKQRKSYMHVDDCISAMLLAVGESRDAVNIFNLGADEYTEVNGSVAWICDHLGVAPKLSYEGGERGWVGDSPFIFLDCSRIRALGWKPKFSIRDGILSTVDWLQENRWVLEARK